MITKSEEEIIKDIAFYREKGDKWEETRAIGLLAAKYKEERKFQKAVDTWLQDAQIRLSLGDSDGAASTYFAIANVYYARPNHPFPGLGNLHQAIDYAKRAIGLESRNEVKARYLVTLAYMWALAEDLLSAFNTLNEAESYQKLGDDRRNFFVKELREYAQKGYENW